MAHAVAESPSITFPSDRFLPDEQFEVAHPDQPAFPLAQTEQSVAAAVTPYDLPDDAHIDSDKDPATTFENNIEALTSKLRSRGIYNLSAAIASGSSVKVKAIITQCCNPDMWIHGKPTTGAERTELAQLAVDTLISLEAAEQATGNVVATERQTTLDPASRHSVEPIAVIPRHIETMQPEEPRHKKMGRAIVDFFVKYSPQPTF